MTATAHAPSPVAVAVPGAGARALRWARRNLFRTPIDGVVTVVSTVIAAYIAFRLVRFVFVTGRWDVVRVNLSLFLVGRFDRDELWRPVVAVLSVAGYMGVWTGYSRTRIAARIPTTGAVIANPENPTTLGGGATVIGAIAQEPAPADDEVGDEGATPTERALDMLGRLWPLIGGVLLLLSLATTVTPWLVAGATAVAALVGYLFGRFAPRQALLLVATIGLIAAAAYFLWVDPFNWLAVPSSVGTVLGVAAAAFVVAAAAALALLRRIPAALLGVGLFGSLALLILLTNAVGWDDWGGLMMNIFLAVISIGLCFPLGVLLALGRRSKMPLIRVVCTAYIELFRGVPLYVLLLMAGIALGFFVPSTITPGLVTRAIAVFTLFTAAYVAEIVRGGLQSLPRGQTEAAQALGLSAVRTTFFIVLPQALRNVIPAMVGQFISLFKDTTLVGGALGFLDLLAGSQAATRQGDFRGQGLLGETIPFVMLLFWVGSITMSRESQRLERKLGVGTR
ncbi:hypothetical protein BH20ACT4_BH20ACT4_11250 [soil metagenome]